jgi:hypothetical protein
MLEIGLERRNGKLTAARRETPLMQPDVLPAVRWSTAARGIEVVRRRSPVLDPAVAHRARSPQPSSSPVAAERSVLNVAARSAALADEARDFAHFTDNAADEEPPRPRRTSAAAARRRPPPRQQATASISPGDARGPAIESALLASSPAQRLQALSNFVVSPVRLGSLARGAGAPSETEFVFLPSDIDPVAAAASAARGSLRRVDAIAAAKPTRATMAALPAAIDGFARSAVASASGGGAGGGGLRALTTASVLESLVARTALLERDRAASADDARDRTASEHLANHIAALLDLSHALATADPNAAAVARRVHDALAAHTARSMSQPLERAATLLENARADASAARAQSAELRAQLLDVEAQVLALRRQCRRCEDTIAYLTAAYSLPTVFRDASSDSPEAVSRALASEASPSSALAAATQRRGGSAASAARGIGAALALREPIAGDGETLIDRAKSLEEQFSPHFTSRS